MYSQFCFFFVIIFHVSIDSTASSYYQNSADMMLVDKWIVVIILGVTLRFFDLNVQRTMLWGHVGGMMIYQIMLSGSPGELMELEAKRAAGIGTFFMILTAMIGAV
jgi:hypothetical protein